MQTTPSLAAPGSAAGSAFRRLLWHAMNSCSLAGLLSWPLESDWVRIERRTMPLAYLAPAFEGATVAHITDLHCGLFVRPGHLRRYVERVNELRPDFVAITGDFITIGRRRDARNVAAVLAGLRPNVATVACLGNHDYGTWHPTRFGETSGMAAYLTKELAGAGIVVLRNASRSFFRGEAALQFVGLEDYWTKAYDPAGVFECVVDDCPTIALVHNPDGASEAAACGAAWVLSGHTHGKATPATRFWDAVYPVRCKQFVAGEYSLGAGRRLYVNPGIGNGFHFRPGRVPEITLFSLVADGRKPLVPGRPARRAASPMTKARETKGVTPPVLGPPAFSFQEESR